MESVQDFFQGGMECFLAHDRIQSGTGANAEDSWSLTAFPAYFAEIDPLHRFSVFLLFDAGGDFFKVFFCVSKDPQVSGEIVAGTSRNHAEADAVKVGDSVQDFVDGSVPSYYQQVDRSLREFCTDLSCQFHCVFFVAGQIGVVWDFFFL